MRLSTHSGLGRDFDRSDRVRRGIPGNDPARILGQPQQMTDRKKSRPDCRRSQMTIIAAAFFMNGFVHLQY
jgi:hypothetical protein